MFMIITIFIIILNIIVIHALLLLLLFYKLINWDYMENIEKLIYYTT